jgi:hypothetical protein
VKLVALTPPKVTIVAPVKVCPVITTLAPTGPLVGLKLVICGTTRNILLLVKVPLEVVMVTRPVVAPLGTLAVRYVPDLTLRVADVPLNETVDDFEKPCPRNSIVAPTFPE